MRLQLRPVLVAALAVISVFLGRTLFGEGGMVFLLFSFPILVSSFFGPKYVVFSTVLGLFASIGILIGDGSVNWSPLSIALRVLAYLVVAAVVMAISSAVHSRNQQIQELLQERDWHDKNTSMGKYLFKLRKPMPSDLSVEEKIGHAYEHGYLADCNLAFVRMYSPDKTPDEFIGAMLGDLVPRDDPNNQAYLRSFFTFGNRITDHPSHEMTEYGPRVFVNNLIGFMNEKGQLVQARGEQWDVTVARQVQEQLTETLAREQEARKVAEEASTAKDRFLAALSHELRTPLNAILHLAYVATEETARLEDTVEYRFLKDAAARILRNTNVLITLVDDLLDLASIRKGKMVLRLVEVDVCETIRRAVETAEVAISNKGIKLELVLDDPCHVSGDPDRLQQVFWNLVSNSVKFTPAGGNIRIVAKTEEEGMVVTVEDTGKGIHADFLPHLFEQFLQAESNSGHKGSLGLGLAIVKEIVTMHGGLVTAESAGVGLGSKFTVTLPRYKEKFVFGPGEQLQPSDAAKDRIKGIKILVVEDNQISREGLVEYLAGFGAEVDGVSSVEMAIKSLASNKYDILISDVHMPEKDGCVMMRQIRDSKADYTGIPALALTGLGRVEDKKMVIEAGFNDHMVKPVEFGKLVERIVALAASPRQS
jgi:signal transduction histidine kinase/ActR/RegA family two-component response regulator